MITKMMIKMMSKPMKKVTRVLQSVRSFYYNGKHDMEDDMELTLTEKICYSLLVFILAPVVFVLLTALLFIGTVACMVALPVGIMLGKAELDVD